MVILSVKQRRIQAVKMDDDAMALSLDTDPVLVKNKAEKWAYVWLRIAEDAGRIAHLLYEDVSFRTGHSDKGAVRYVPDFTYIDKKTNHWVALEIKGFRRPNVARGVALFRARFPWIEFRMIDSKDVKSPYRLGNLNPFFCDVENSRALVWLEDLNVLTEAEGKLLMSSTK